MQTKLAYAVAALLIQLRGCVNAKVPLRSDVSNVASTEEHVERRRLLQDLEQASDEQVGESIKAIDGAEGGGGGRDGDGGSDGGSGSQGTSSRDAAEEGKEKAAWVQAWAAAPWAVSQYEHMGPRATLLQYRPDAALVQAFNNFTQGNSISIDGGNGASNGVQLDPKEEEEDKEEEGEDGNELRTVGKKQANPAGKQMLGRKPAGKEIKTTGKQTAPLVGKQASATGNSKVVDAIQRPEGGGGGGNGSAGSGKVGSNNGGGGGNGSGGGSNSRGGSNVGSGGSGNSGDVGKSGSVSRNGGGGTTGNFQIRSTYAWYPMGLANYDYLGRAYSPGMYQGQRRVYLCHSDEGLERRPIGVTWAEGEGAGTFRACYYAYRNKATGDLSVGKVDDTRFWSVMVDYKPPGSNGRSVYTWADRNAVLQECRQQRDNVPGAQCGLVPGNYAEESSGVGFSPARWICRWENPDSGNDFFGWSDARIGDDGTVVEPECNFWNWNPEGQRRPNSKTENVQLMVFVRSYHDPAEILVPRALTCGGGCRSVPDFPQGFYPGMAGYDIVEGAFHFTFDVASCCLLCQRTPGCHGYMFNARGQNWCWLKYTNTFPQTKTPQGFGQGQGAQSKVGGAPTVVLQPAPFMGDFEDRWCPVGQPANAASYNAIIPEGTRAAMRPGPACKTRQVRDRKDAGGCGVLLGVHARSMDECCTMCQRYNDMAAASKVSGGGRCRGWSYYKIYEQCFFRGRDDCDLDNLDHAWTHNSVISAVLHNDGLYSEAAK